MSAEKKEKILGVDFATSVQMRSTFDPATPYGPDMIDRLMAQSADAGFTTIYWRTAESGQVTYHSKVRTRSDAVLVDRPRVHYGGLDAAEETRESLRVAMRLCNPPETAVAAARRHGLRIYIYTTLFDESIPGVEGEFGIQHPECCWQHRHYAHHVPGLLSYGHEEVRDYKLAEIDEMIAFGADGIYLDCARSHAGNWPVMALPYGSDVWANYGFNAVECAEYQRRHGHAPRLDNLANITWDRIDWPAWQRLRGEYLTQFVRAASAKVRAAGQRLSVGFYTDAACYLSPAGQRGRQNLGGLHIDWETWARDRLIDDIVLIAEHRRFGDHDWTTHSQPQFAEAQRSGIRVHVWAATEHRIDEAPPGEPVDLPISVKQQPQRFFAHMRRRIENILSASADGLYCYEHARIEEAADHLGIDYWSELRAAMGRA